MIAVFTDRTGGVSRPPFDSLNLAVHVGDDPGDVVENRALLEELLGTRLVWMSQVHGATAREVVAPASEAGECDAVALGPALGDHSPAVLVADCVPVLLADSTGSHRAAVHVGRAGLFGGVLPNTIALLREATGSALYAVTGPHICGACYEVGGELAEEARELGAGCTTRWGTPGIDLLAGIRRQLGDIPLTALGGCTFEDARFFSHRRDGSTGRCAGVILRDTPSAMWGGPIRLR